MELNGTRVTISVTVKRRDFYRGFPQFYRDDVYSFREEQLTRRMDKINGLQQVFVNYH